MHFNKPNITYLVDILILSWQRHHVADSHIHNCMDYKSGWHKREIKICLLIWVMTLCLTLPPGSICPSLSSCTVINPNITHLPCVVEYQFFPILFSLCLQWDVVSHYHDNGELLWPMLACNRWSPMNYCVMNGGRGLCRCHWLLIKLDGWCTG